MQKAHIIQKNVDQFRKKIETSEPEMMARAGQRMDEFMEARNNEVFERIESARLGASGDPGSSNRGGEESRPDPDLPTKSRNPLLEMDPDLDEESVSPPGAQCAPRPGSSFGGGQCPPLPRRS